MSTATIGGSTLVIILSLNLGLVFFDRNALNLPGTAGGLTLATGAVGGGVIAPCEAGRMADGVGLQALLWLIGCACLIVAIGSWAPMESAPRSRAVAR